MAVYVPQEPSLHPQNVNVSAQLGSLIEGSTRSIGKFHKQECRSQTLKAKARTEQCDVCSL